MNGKTLVKAILVLFLCGAAFGQDISKNYIQPFYTVVELEGTEEKTVFLTFPIPDHLYQGAHPGIVASLDGLTVPQDIRKFQSNGAAFLHIIPVFDTAEESDSLYVKFKPLSYDLNREAWAVSSNDSSFALWNAYDLWTTNTASYLDWTSESMYTLNLSGSLWPAAGVAITIGQKAANVASAATEVNVAVYLSR